MATWADQDLRAEFVDTAVKAVALMEYKLKNLCTISPSSSFIETYFQETNTELTGGTGSSVGGIPRNAPFPYGEVIETKASSRLLKYGMEGYIAEEDILFDNVPMLQRTILRIGRAVAYKIDQVIAAAMLASAGNTFSIAATYEWDSATEINKLPITDILFAIDMLAKDNLDALNGNGYLCVNGTDYMNLVSNTKFINHPTYQSVSVVENGKVGKICGLTIMKTEALEATTPDVAYVVIANEAMVWKEAQALKVEQIKNPGIGTTIRAWEFGVCQVVAPNAICKIQNTRK